MLEQAWIDILDKSVCQGLFPLSFSCPAHTAVSAIR